MKRLALVAAIATLGYWSGAVEAGDYNPIYEPALQVQYPEQAAFIGLDQYFGLYLAVGEYGTILRRTSGTEWAQQEVPTSVLLTEVQLIDEQYAWAAGHEGVLLQSTDGGQNWEMRLDGYELLDLEYAWLLAEEARLEEAIDAAEDPLVREDLEWELEELYFHLDAAEIQQDVGPTKPFLDIHFRNREHGFALAAYGTVLETQDGGETWEIITGRFDNPMGRHFNMLAEAKRGDLFMAGEDGMIAHSEDAGQTWEMLTSSPYHGSYFGVTVDQEERVWVYGLRGNLYVSEDYGDTWQQIPTDIRYNLNNALPLADGRLAVVGHSGVIVLVDPDNDYEFEFHSHFSSSPLTDIRQGAGTELILVGRDGLQQFLLPVTPGQ